LRIDKLISDIIELPERATALVGAIAHAKIETSATAMGKSLKSAGAILECLRSTKWDLFSVVAQVTDQRKADADLLLDDVRSWLKVDEHALAGGLAEVVGSREPGYPNSHAAEGTTANTAASPTRSQVEICSQRR
jgi:hypothetical protein